MIEADRSGSWSAYSAALWAFVFGLLHIAWAAGWYVGLDAEGARKAFQQRWFLAYDLCVASTCFFAVAVALALVRPWGHRLPRWAIGLVAWLGVGVLVLRSVSSLVHLLYSVAAGTFAARPMHLWELWFYLGAILFGLATWRFWTARPESSVAG